MLLCLQCEPGIKVKLLKELKLSYLTVLENRRATDYCEKVSDFA